jgi:hypothetical protein
MNVPIYYKRRKFATTKVVRTRMYWSPVSKTTFSDLPRDMLVEIATYLRKDDIKAFLCVNRMLYSTKNDDMRYKIDFAPFIYELLKVLDVASITESIEDNIKVFDVVVKFAYTHYMFIQNKKFKQIVHDKLVNYIKRGKVEFIPYYENLFEKQIN